MPERETPELKESEERLKTDAFRFDSDFDFDTGNGGISGAGTVRKKRMFLGTDAGCFGLSGIV